MIPPKQLQSILALLKSEDEASILLAIYLINSYETFVYPPQDDQLLGNDLLKGFQQPNALYTYQGIKNEASIISIVDTWKPLVEKLWQQDETIPQRKLSSIIIQLLCFEKTYQTRESNHQIKLVVQQHPKYYQIFLQDVWEPEKLSKLIFYIQQSNKTIDDLWTMQKPSRLYRRKNPIHPFLQGTTDIVRRTGTLIKYAIHPCPDYPLVALAIQVTINTD
ncbi:hypothetical protein [uncultured Microscilla sp.]|uniref:hypothetical protein n=1 Tax=uncultured Microscilla sp. TaxID=432653 RepID=UPI002626712A|nr:hypothetical protein [uncultured Microscilla sp.]